MPELVEQLYCSQQIVIPPQFPYILKKFAKAAIKTQPYDLLRWSYEYFHALSESRVPPVKLRLEYPVFSSEGGLTRGYLKVLARQLHIQQLPIVSAGRVRALWKGACLDTSELRRLLLLTSPKGDQVESLRLIAVAAGLLTKSLTQTMILLCETLTREPDGGSAAVPLDTFLMMYRFLAEMDASKDCRFVNGRPEGEPPEPSITSEFFATEAGDLGDGADDAANEKLCQLSKSKAGDTGEGEPLDLSEEEDIDEHSEEGVEEGEEEEENKPEEKKEFDVKEYVRQCYEDRERRYEDLLHTFSELAAIVDRFLSATYDLGMVAGRQMSTTSAEFIVQNIQKDIMSYIDEMIAILPDPDLKKKKAKPEEVQMIRDMLEQFLDDNMAAIAPETEEVEEEEEPIPEIVTVYAIPGIGPRVEPEVLKCFVAYARDVAQHQEHMFMPRNIRHFLCPPLEKLIQHDYEEHRKEFEEIAASGKME